MWTSVQPIASIPGRMRPISCVLRCCTSIRAVISTAEHVCDAGPVDAIKPDYELTEYEMPYLEMNGQ